MQSTTLEFFTNTVVDIHFLHYSHGVNTLNYLIQHIKCIKLDMFCFCAAQCRKCYTKTSIFSIKHTWYSVVIAMQTVVEKICNYKNAFQ